jgi:hypothetical protein
MEPVLQTLIVRNAVGNKLNKPVANTFPVLCFFLPFFFAAWSAWAIFLFHHPGMDPTGGIRALVRLLIWVVPVLAFVSLVEKEPVLPKPALGQHVSADL